MFTTKSTNHSAKPFCAAGVQRGKTFPFESQLALDNIGYSRTERKSCFPMCFSSSSSSRGRNKYGGIWSRSVNFFKGCSLCYCGAICRRVLLFVCSLSHIPPYVFLSREDDHDVRDVGKHHFRSVLLHHMLSNANGEVTTNQFCESITHCSMQS